MNRPRQPLLVVDLDETFLRTDLVWEALSQLARRKPHLLLLVPLMFLRGRVRFKHWIDRHVELDLDAMPRNDAVERFVRSAKADGRTVVLATASLRRWVERWAKQLGCFDHVLGTDTINLRGKAKLERIRAEFDGCEFDYIGNSGADVPLWRAARAAFVSGDRRRYERRIGKPFAGEFPIERPTIADWFGQLRIEQWSKNLLVLVPLMLAHRLGDPAALGAGLVAALLLSIAASALYVFNDILDLERDRAHPAKRNRPLARGIVPLRHAWIAVGVGSVASIVAASLVLPSAALIVLLLYATVSAGYSLAFKHIAVVDIIVLGGLYTLRIILGGVATGTEISTWLLGFAFVFFTGLALLKRHSEAVHARSSGHRFDSVRPYDDRDESFLLAAGIATSAMAAVILILYLTSERVRQLYSHPERLWAVLPLVLLWTMRMWRLSVRGELSSDPLSAALRDRASLAIAVAVVAIVTILAR
jgi:4-hydroxybenzoate polyprenyltransferase/phosphoserine phosphatase